VGLVLGLHLALLQQAPLWLLAAPARAAQPAPERDHVTTPVQLLPPPEPVVAKSPAPAPATTSTTQASPPPRSAAPKPVRAQTAPARSDVPEAQASATLIAKTDVAPPAADLSAGPDAIPQPPPSVLLNYHLQRGFVQGSGMLEWRNEAAHYRLSLEGKLPLLGSIFVQHSEGGFDAAGLAPRRHTEQRLRRSERAVNFVRPTDGSAPHIAFSASTTSLPLRPGAQDRVSWMAQLATRLAGVRRLPVGSRLEMDVASSGGEVQQWVFVLQQIAADGSWHWRRQSEQPGDTLAEVWTDPALGHWPRRVRLTERHGEALELTLRQMQPLPP
jgi:hypothetical protein